MLRYWPNDYDRLEGLQSRRKKALESPNHSPDPSARLAHAGDIGKARQSAIIDLEMDLERDGEPCRSFHVV
jgi:hypothetical protein